jgi:nucleotide-binding universal stress UspA family protein
MWHQAGEAVLDDALAELARQGVRAEGHSVDGAAPEAIVNVATRVGADLIVVGNRGMYGARASQASVPHIVVRQAPCHVLIARTS